MGGVESISPCVDSSKEEASISKRLSFGKRQPLENKYSDFYNGMTYSFERRLLSSWNQVDIRTFLRCCGFPGLFKFVIDSILATGRNTFQAFIVSKHSTQKMLKRVVQGKDETKTEFEKRKLIMRILFIKLRLCTQFDETFSLDFYRVIKKFVDNLKNFDEVSVMGLKTLVQNCNTLSNKKAIKKYFFTTADFKALLASKKVIKIPVKIVISESFFTTQEKFLRRMISPVLQYMPSLRQEYGLFHTGIIIGPAYLHWTTSEIIVPKTAISSGAALFVADITSDYNMSVNDSEMNRVENLIESLGVIIHKWNSKCRYKQIRETPWDGNCQDFVQDTLEFLKLPTSIDTNSAYGKYLDNIRKTGSALCQFEPTKEFRKDFELERELIEFKTHTELDDFLNNIVQHHQLSNFDFKFKYPGVYQLLKSFDRAFWLRYRKDQNNQKWKPAPFRGCFFKDPSESKSFIDAFKPVYDDDDDQ